MSEPASFRIRDAGPEDDALLLEVRRRASLSNEGDRELLLAHPEVFEAGEVPAHVGTRVAEADRIVGYATARGGGAVVEITALFVEPDWMGRGVGRALVADLVSAATSRGAAAIEVTANEHALAFYQRLGFRAAGVVDTPLGVPAPRLRRPLDALD
ncbi:MAG: GNAT family N-acetyltransferase [Actinomycetota bacterium]